MKTVAELVTEMQGCKGTELVVVLADNGLTVSDLEKAVSDGEVIEIEYVLPTMNYRTKSFFLPKGTKVRRGRR